MSENAKEQQPQLDSNRPIFDLHRVYAKDSSLETPHSPLIFKAKWEPELKVNFDTKTSKISDDMYEVALRITITCKNDEQTAFICEVTQAGLFQMRSIPNEAGEFLLGGTAPNILFPYAREFISSLVSRATFPQLNLAPINFEALFRARKAQQEAQAQQTAAASNEEKSEPAAKEEGETKGKKSKK